MTLEKEIQKRREAYDQIRRERLKPAYDWIVANATKRKSIAEASKIVGMNRSDFTANFRRVFGMTPKRFASTEQIRIAKELMLRGISQHRAWDRCGFRDSQSLSVRFKQITGQTITQWKKENGF